MPRHYLFPLVFSSALLLSPSSTWAKDLTPQETVKEFQQALKDRQPARVYALLPASYQSKIQGLARTSVASIDPKIWKQAIAVLQKASKTLKAREGLFLALVDEAPDYSQTFAFDPDNPDKKISKEEIAKRVAERKKKEKDRISNTIARICALINKITADPTLSDHSKAKSLDVSALLKSQGPAVMTFIEKVWIYNPTGEDNGIASDFQNIKVVRSDKATATISNSPPGAPDYVETLTLVKVEGKWIPSEMHQAFTRGYPVAQKTIVDKLQKDPNTAKLMQTGLDQLNSIVDALGKAKKLQDLQGTIEKTMFGQFFGGPGRPPADDDIQPQEDRE